MSKYQIPPGRAIGKPGGGVYKPGDRLPEFSEEQIRRFVADGSLVRATEEVVTPPPSVAGGGVNPGARYVIAPGRAIGVAGGVVRPGDPLPPLTDEQIRRFVADGSLVEEAEGTEESIVGDKPEPEPEPEPEEPEPEEPEPEEPEPEPPEDVDPASMSVRDLADWASLACADDLREAREAEVEAKGRKTALRILDSAIVRLGG